MAGKTGKVRSKSVSDSVADLAEFHNIDQVVLLGWREKGGEYVQVAHGRNKQDQAEADSFAARLMEGIGLPSNKSHRLKSDDENDKNSSAKEGR